MKKQIIIISIIALSTVFYSVNKNENIHQTNNSPTPEKLWESQKDKGIAFFSFWGLISKISGEKYQCKSALAEGKCIPPIAIPEKQSDSDKNSDSTHYSSNMIIEDSIVDSKR